MRIVGGVWAGTGLTSPGGRVRPTGEAVRDGWVTWLETEIRGARVLDLFAGTGALGLEALSRGAGTVDFVENGAAALHALKANVAAVRARGRTRIFKRDAIPYVERLGPGAYDIAFADPPYGSRKLDRVVTRWQEVPFARLLAVEHDADRLLPWTGERRRFGDIAITLFRADVRAG